MGEKGFGLDEVVEMKKRDGCGGNGWKVIGLGMDIGIKWEGWGQRVMMGRRDFEGKMKKIVVKDEEGSG
ncbi:DUF951 family protein [Bacillus altitudinis]|uniref:DUF951 family protein n=1 Tax=Bacillus altitudinis TaxID=293387 RepID=UPI0011A1C7BE|nr:DUF951 family protein [Bacillus altitudinis]